MGIKIPGKMCKIYAILYGKMGGMNKLIQYINEYGKTNGCGPFEYYRVEPISNYYYTSYLVLQWDDNGEGDWKDWHLPIPILISKDYGFIKWLVENDKIETNNLSLKAFKNIFSGGGFVEVSDLEVLLMLLSISDTPIEDLISYLK